MIVERIASRWPAPTLSNAERIEIWRRQYLLVPFEQQIGATAVHSLPRSEQFNPSEPRRESRTLCAASTPPAGCVDPPNSAPATVATAGTFWTRFMALPSLDWVESWAFIGPSLVAVLAALALKVSP